MAKKRPGSGLSPTQQAAKFLGVSVLAGAVLAGIALPAAGALGLAAKGTVEGFDELPANMKRPPLSERTTILDSEGGRIATVYSRNRTVVDLEAISPSMQKAIVAIEDARFYEHGAVDLKGVLRAANQNAQSGGVSQGASTLTQQYVKNVFVEEAGDDADKVAQATQQTIGRKIRELKYAIQVEEELGKKRILENYLNITFFGQQAYGIEAAAERYFSSTAKDLTLAQSAMLAGLVQSPSRYDPVAAPQEAKKRRDVVLQRMAELHDVSQAEAEKAKDEPLGLEISKPAEGCITAERGAGFFCDYVRKIFQNDPAFGKTKEDRARLWNRGGLTIRTTLDPQAQDAVQESVRTHVLKSDEVASAATLVEPGTGKITAMGQSRPYGIDATKGETSVNLSVGGAMGGGMGYQPGSTFKPILAAAALDRGKQPTQRYSSPYRMAYPDQVATCDGKTWHNDANGRLENENKSEVGPYGMKEATAKSVNTYFVQLIEDIGICPVIDMAEAMGLDPADGMPIPQVPSIALGTATMSPLTMAGAYATFASRGTYCTPVAVLSVTDPDGKSLPVPKSQCTRAMSQKTADTVSTLLKGVVEDGTGRQAGLGTGRPSAGKTGTTDERRAAWFVGYTPNLAGAVWVGDPANERRMVDIEIGGRYHEKVFGGGVPGPIWKDAMLGALEGRPAPDLSLVNIPGGDKERPRPDDRPKPDKPDDGRPGGDGGGDSDPWPDVSFPPDFIGGGGNGGNGGGRGNGGGGWGP